MESKRSNIGLIALIVALVCVLFLGRAAYSLLAGQDASRQTASTAATATAQKGSQSSPLLPSFPLLDASGTGLDSIDLLDGRPLIINFWATWCPYCVDEMPDYQRLYEKYGDDVRFVMIDVADGRQETVEKAAAYIEENGFTFPVYYDTTGRASGLMGVSSYPSSAIVSAEGEILIFAPGRISYEAVDAELAKLIEG